MDWNTLRAEEFPVTANWAYFDHAAAAPLPRRSAKAMNAWISEQESNGVIGWPSWKSKLEHIRQDAARLIQADPDEVAFIHSTTQGIGLIAEGFPWKNGDNVVTSEEEYPSNIYPWMNLADRGVSLRTVPSRDGRVDPKDLAAALDDRTRILAISHVEWLSGFRNDLDLLAELSHARGAALFVDAIQGLGPLTIDMRRTPIDFLATGGHKWLLGPEGAGILYVRKHWIDRLRPLGVGWHSVTSSYNTPGIHFDLKPSAQRWEGGTFNMPGIQAFGASIGLLLELGPEAVSQRIIEHAETVREIAQRAGWTVHGSDRVQERSGIVAMTRTSVEAEPFVRDLRKRGIALAARRGRVRVSPHVYNNREDLDRLAEALAAP